MRQYWGHFYGRLSMSAVISNCSRYFIKNIRTNNLIDDPDRDVAYHCLREYFSLGNAINKPRRWSRAKIHVNGRSTCKHLLRKHETVLFTWVNVAALPTSMGIFTV